MLNFCVYIGVLRLRFLAYHFRFFIFTFALFLIYHLRLFIFTLLFLFMSCFIYICNVINLNIYVLSLAHTLIVRFFPLSFTCPDDLYEWKILWRKELGNRHVWQPVSFWQRVEEFQNPNSQRGTTIWRAEWKTSI